MKSKLSTSIKGFTLIELLVVIGILTILLAIVLVAINPSRQFAQANNTQRRSDVNAILNAVHQYAADNKGTLPTGITTAPALISGTGLCNALVPTYLAQLPVDPTAGTWTSCSSYTAGYNISVSATANRVTVAAPNAQDSVTISVTR